MPLFHLDLAATLALEKGEQERRDVRRSGIVDRGIAVQTSSNTVSAIEFLKSHDIDPVVIERVLLEPHRRRGAPGA